MIPLHVSYLGDTLAASADTHAGLLTAVDLLAAEARRRVAVLALLAANGHRGRAAAACGLPARTFASLLATLRPGELDDLAARHGWPDRCAGAREAKRTAAEALREAEERQLAREEARVEDAGGLGGLGL